MTTIIFPREIQHMYVIGCQVHRRPDVGRELVGGFVLSGVNAAKLQVQDRRTGSRDAVCRGTFLGDGAG